MCIPFPSTMKEKHPSPTVRSWKKAQLHNWEDPKPVFLSSFALQLVKSSIQYPLIQKKTNFDFILRKIKCYW